MTLAERVTFPANPLMLTTLMTVPSVSVVTVLKVDGFAEISKPELTMLRLSAMLLVVDPA